MKDGKSSYKIALIQMAPDSDPQVSLRRAEERILEAAGNGAQLICLPELFLGPYFCQIEDASFFDRAEPIPGPTTEAIGNLAKRTKTVILAPLFEKRAAGIYHNSVVALDSNGKIAGHYRKMHIPDDPLYYEKFYFTPGDLGFRVFETSLGKIGCLICWDQWFPEAARLVSLQGADILVYPTAIGWHPSEKSEYGVAQQDSWVTIQRSHAIANGVFVASVNRVGHEKGSQGGDGIEFWGSSFLTDPQGQFLTISKKPVEEILYGTVEPRKVEEIRRNWPFLRDRRVDAYGDIGRRFIDA